MSWWTVGMEQTLADDVPAPPADVRDFYVDLRNMKLVHPLVVSVRTISRRDTTDGYIEDYRVGDRIPLGKLTVPISYRVRLAVPAGGDVVTSARQFPRVRLDGTVSFEAVGVGTRIVERLSISAPAPLAGLTTRQAVRAHRAMLGAIRRHFESVP